MALQYFDIAEYSLNGGELNQPFFNEEDIKSFFGKEKEALKSGQEPTTNPPEKHSEPFRFDLKAIIPKPHTEAQINEKVNEEPSIEFHPAAPHKPNISQPKPGEADLSTLYPRPPQLESAVRPQAPAPVPPRSQSVDFSALYPRTPQPGPNVAKPALTSITPPTPPPGALPKIENSYSDFYGIPKPTFGQTVARFFGVFILLFGISYTIINGPALIKKIKYFWETEYRNKSWATNFQLPVANKNESRIIIPKINVNAPIIWDVPVEESIKNLENGAVHYKDTAHPGQSGNVFITGHSSYYLWAPGDYKDLFALLDKLNAGDKIYIQYNGATFTYSVNNQKVINPDDLSVLEQGDGNTLSLMTCVPIGTSLQRLVVTATQVSS